MSHHAQPFLLSGLHGGMDLAWMSAATSLGCGGLLVFGGQEWSGIYLALPGSLAFIQVSIWHACEKWYQQHNVKVESHSREQQERRGQRDPLLRDKGKASRAIRNTVQIAENTTGAQGLPEDRGKALLSVCLYHDLGVICGLSS